MQKCLVHIYTGDGKGKTTASMGLAVRCRGYGKKVSVYQFLKASPTGELDSLKKLGIEVIRVSSSDKFYFNMNDKEKSLVKKETQKAIESIKKADCDLLILDEILCAADVGIIEIKSIIDIIKEKPDHTEIVMTGRNMSDCLMEYADYITEMKCIKHPYNQGICARECIEY